jgi:hypothetical protein
VHLDAGERLVLAVGVAADVVTAIDDGDLAARGGALRDGEAEEARADDEEIHQTPSGVGSGAFRRAQRDLPRELGDLRVLRAPVPHGRERVAHEDDDEGVEQQIGASPHADAQREVVDDAGEQHGEDRRHQQEQQGDGADRLVARGSARPQQDEAEDDEGPDEETLMMI